MIKMASVWEGTTEFVGEHLGALLPIALLTIFVPTSVQQNLTVLLATAPPGMKAVLTVVTVALWLVMLWGQLAITARVIDPTAVRGTSVAIATRRLLPAIGALILAGLLVGLVLVPSVVLLAAYGFNFAAAGEYRNAALPEGAGLPLLIVFLVTVPLAVWLMARTYVLLTAVVVGEGRAFGAIGRAFALSRGLVWKIVGVLLLYAIVSSVCGLAARTVFGSVFELVAGGEGAMSLATILTSVVTGAVSAIFAVLATVFCATLYLAITRQDDLTLA